MKKINLLLFGIIYISIIFTTNASSGASPYMTGPCGTNDDAYLDSDVQCTLTDDTTCDDPSSTFNFVNNSEFWEALNGYSSHKWVFDGSVIKNTTALSSSVQIDIDNLSAGSHTLNVVAYSPSTSRTFHYNFAVEKYNPTPDLVVYSSSNSTSVTENNSFSLKYSVNNTGEAVCSPTETQIRIWWSQDKTIDSSEDKLAKTITDATIENGSTISWNSVNITAPELSDFGATGVDFISIRPLIEVDYNSTIIESNENNNTSKGDDLVITLNSANTSRISEINYNNIQKVMDLTGNIICDGNCQLTDLLKSDAIYVVYYLDKQNELKKKMVKSVQ